MKGLKNRARFFMKFFLHTILFSENERNQVKEPSHLACLNHNKTNQKYEGYKWWNLSELVTNTLASLILVIFSAP